MYFVRRLIFLVPLVLVISFLAFCLVHVAPGGPFDKDASRPRRKWRSNSRRSITWINHCSFNTGFTWKACCGAISGRR